MTRLYLIRHGEVDAPKLYYGQTDVPLTETGQAQAQAAAHALRRQPLRAVYSSDLQRAALGARLVAQAHGLSPQTDPAFREMHLGLLEGLSWAHVRSEYPQLAAKRYPDMWTFRFPEGGENLQDVLARVQPALERILAHHPQETVALVSHNSVNRLLLGQALGLPDGRFFGFEQGFGCINCIEYGEKTQVTLLNWTPDGLA